MMNSIASLLGLILFLTGVIGFVNNDFLGMDLNFLHSVFLTLIGVISLFFGTRGTEFEARYLCLTLGIVFGVLAIATFLAGPGIASAGNAYIYTNHVLKLIHGQLEFTSADGVLCLIIGVVGCFAGFFSREKEIEIDMAFQKKQLAFQKKQLEFVKSRR